MTGLYSNDKVRERSERIVQEDVIYCVSSLIYELSRSNARYELGIDDELTELSQVADYDEPAEQFIEKMDREEMIEYLDNQCVDLNRFEETDDDHRDDDVDHTDEQLRVLVRHEAFNEQGTKEFCEEFDINADYSEVFEHWIVSSWLARKLQERGHVVTEVLGLTVWGRPTTGQAISMDGVMLSIANELENL